VVGLVQKVYGDSYLHQELYRAERITELNQLGKLVSVVALSADSGVVGHYALERPELGQIAEEGEAMVHPEHRHHHLMEEMRGLLESEAHRLGLTGLFGQAVTNHVFTQRTVERYDLRLCGLSLGATPRSFHNMPKPLTQRMSLLLYFKYLRPPSKSVAYLPAHHQHIIKRIYDQFNLAVEYPEPAAPTGTGRITANFDSSLCEGMIRVEQIGAETAMELGRITRHMCLTASVETCFLELPLSQVGTPHLCHAAEQHGFFFSGIGPCFAADGDALRLQRLNVPLDTSQLQLESSFARELVSYVESERQRVARGRQS
jgi:hypothetical protein